MRMMKKVLTGMSVAAFSLLVAGGMDASAADATATFDADKQTMDVRASGCKEVQVSFNYITVKTVKGEKTLVANPKAVWDVYTDGSEAKTVDLSNLKTAADTYIAVKGEDQSVPTVYKIPAYTKKYTGKYAVTATVETPDNNAGGFTFWTGKEEKTDETASGVLEYRTVNSDAWTTYTKSNFKTDIYEKQGSTVYFRIAAAAMTVGNAEDIDGISIKTVSGNFAGAEFKVKATKEAAAPAATINYDAGTFTVKKGTEYRQMKEVDGSYLWLNDYKDGKFVKAASDKTTTVVSIDPTIAGIFEVRTAASSTKNAKTGVVTGKIPSKIAVYKYAAVSAPSDFMEAAANSQDAMDKLQVKVISVKDLPENGKLKYVCQTAKKTDDELDGLAPKSKPANASKYSLINESKTTYIVYAASNVDANGKIVTTTKKLGTLAPGKFLSLTEYTANIETTAAHKTSKIYIAAASNKANGQWLTPTTEVEINWASKAPVDPE